MNSAVRIDVDYPALGVKYGDLHTSSISSFSSKISEALFAPYIAGLCALKRLNSVAGNLTDLFYVIWSYCIFGFGSPQLFLSRTFAVPDLRTRTVRKVLL